MNDTTHHDSEKAYLFTTQITPMARWGWIRWVNTATNPGTRLRRIEVSMSKLGNGKRRPCCFNLASWTDPALLKSGVFLGTA